MIQWLGPYAFTDEGKGSVSGQGTKIDEPRSTAKIKNKKKHWSPRNNECPMWPNLPVI